jgi:hypothetical protein
MKIIQFFFMCFLLTVYSVQFVNAQIPRTISYQGVLAQQDGKFVPDGNHTLTLNLYESPVGGTAIYNEVQTVSVVKGIFSCMIGSVTLLPSSISFDRAYFLGVSIDGGNELTPRTAFTSAPYALYAEHAGTAETFTHSGTGATAIPGIIHGKVRLYDVIGSQYRDLSKVKVELEGTTYSTFSDIQGNWELRDIPPGGYTIRCSKSGFGFTRFKGFQFAGNGDAYTPTPFALSTIATATYSLDSVFADVTYFHFIVNNFNFQGTRGGYLIAISEKKVIDPLDSSNYYFTSWNINLPEHQGSLMQQVLIFDLRMQGLLKPGRTYYASVFSIGANLFGGSSSSMYYEPVSGQNIYTSTGPCSEVVPFVMP